MNPVDVITNGRLLELLDAVEDTTVAGAEIREFGERAA